jgi:hypothetical protein
VLAALDKYCWTVDVNGVYPGVYRHSFCAQNTISYKQGSSESLLQSKDGTCTTSCCGSRISRNVVAFPACLLYPFLTASSRQELLGLEATAPDHGRIGSFPPKEGGSQRSGLGSLSFLPGVSLELMLHEPFMAGACPWIALELEILQPIKVQGITPLLQQV